MPEKRDKIILELKAHAHTDYEVKVKDFHRITMRDKDNILSRLSFLFGAFLFCSFFLCHFHLHPHIGSISIKILVCNNGNCVRFLETQLPINY